MFDRDQTTNLATAILEFRRMRAEDLPAELFHDPAWDFLLELFVADAQGVRLTGREVSRRSGISPRVISMWLLHLSKLRLVVGDGEGDLDDLLTLSPDGVERMERLLGRARALKDALADAE